MPEFTPMMKQYFSIKERHPGCILMFRMGDFYEMFFDDAKTVSSELELVLTGRDCGQEERAPMCGVPYHSAEGYIARLVQRGYKVAICEQIEDPALAQGLVKRDVIRIITPGTVVEHSMLDEGRNNYLAALWIGEDAGLCFADCSTGEVHVTRIAGEDMIGRVCSELGRFRPSEILVNDAAAEHRAVGDFLVQRLGVGPSAVDAALFSYDGAAARALEQFRVSSLADLRLEDSFSAVRALGAVLAYLKTTQKTGLERLAMPNVYSDAQFMHLDPTARRNLELTETMRGADKRGSLLGILDQTGTAMGRRLIRSWIEQPLINPVTILRRHAAVGELVSETVRRGELIVNMKNIHDIERIMTRIVFGSANARELRSLAQTIPQLAGIRGLLEGLSAPLLAEIMGKIDPLEDIRGLIESAIVDDPPFSVREGGMIRAGYNPELDGLNFEMTDGKGVIARVEAAEKEATGIRTLKVGYNRVFGYYIEISRSYAGELPAHYIRKQTLANTERYITEELRELESRVLGAKDRAVALEYQLFTDLRTAIALQIDRINATAQAVAQLDVLCSFAAVAVKRQYCCPVVDVKSRIDIRDGRHPVVEALLDAPFVPNDTLLDGGDNRVALITGPNMAGKSTYMRQTALIVLMAQIGSFVPAARAEIGVVDAIFTRVGASDDLSAGQSTFMVEMSEVAAILRSATKNSLIIFDEIGRGTSTFDGMSIARAVLEHTANPKKLGAKTMFATHYHELTAMEAENPAIRNYNIAVKKRGDDITFLRRIVRGPADDSYGIEVAKLAGIPDSVVARAKAVLKQLEDSSGQWSVVSGQKSGQSASSQPEQIYFASATESRIVERLRALDVNTLTPLE
ncbi:MAG: DNA mismatch repair protein MutS, partial [Oscillospiraceae bacterium]|nr:DNA mismatch repair protein MutS [Oscillospiraceae bacterium]